MLYLITCAGTFNDGTRHYADNIIIGARLVRSVSLAAVLPVGFALFEERLDALLGVG